MDFKDLVEKAKYCKYVLTKTEIFPGSSSIFFIDNQLCVFNGSVLMVSPCDINPLVNCSVTGTAFIELVTKGSCDTIKFTDKSIMVFNSNSSRKYRLALQDNPTLQITEQLQNKIHWEKIPADFQTALKCCKIALNPKHDHHILTHVKIDGDSLETCDGMKAASFTFKGKGSMSPVLLPGDTVFVLLSISETPTKYSLLDRSLFIGWDSGMYVRINVDTKTEQYPDTSSFYSKGKTSRIHLIDPDEAEESIKRILLLNNTEHPYVQLSTKTNKLIVEVQNPETGTGKEVLQAECDGGLSWCMHYKHVKPMFDHSIFHLGKKGILAEDGPFKMYIANITK